MKTHSTTKIRKKHDFSPPSASNILNKLLHCPFLKMVDSVLYVY